MSEFPYAVVRFTNNDNSGEPMVSEIPSNWILPSAKHCLWPPPKLSRKLSCLITTREPPSQGWELLDITVEARCTSLDSARHQAFSESCRSSSQGRGKRKKCKRPFSDMESCSDASRDSEHTPTLGKVSRSFLSASSQNNLVGEIIYDPLSSGSGYEPDDETPCQNSVAGDAETEIKTEGLERNESTSIIDYFEKKLLPTILEMKSLLQSCDKRLKKLEGERLQVGGSDPFFTTITDAFPIKSMDDLHVWDNFLGKENGLTEFTNFCRVQEGSNPKDTLIRILRRLFSDQFAMQCSWLGRGKNHLGEQNIKISESRVITTIRMLFMGFYEKLYREKEFDQFGSEWFRFSGQRFKRDVSKSNESAPVTVENAIVT